MKVGEIPTFSFDLIKLAKFYNTSIDFLVGLTDEKIPYRKIKKKKHPMS